MAVILEMLIFDYSWFLEIQLNRYKLLLFLWFIIIQLLFFWSLVIIFPLFVLDLFLNWSNQRSLILNIFHRWGCKFSVGCIQTWHMDFLTLQVCRILWQGCRLGVQTCSIKLVAFLDIKYPSSSLLKPSFVYFWLVCIIFIGSSFIDPVMVKDDTVHLRHNFY